MSVLIKGMEMPKNGEYAEERGANMLRHVAIETPTIIPSDKEADNG